MHRHSLPQPSENPDKRIGFPPADPKENKDEDLEQIEITEESKFDLRSAKPDSDELQRMDAIAGDLKKIYDYARNRRNFSFGAATFFALLVIIAFKLLDKEYKRILHCRCETNWPFLIIIALTFPIVPFFVDGLSFWCRNIEDKNTSIPTLKKRLESDPLFKENKSHVVTVLQKLNIQPTSDDPLDLADAFQKIVIEKNKRSQQRCAFFMAAHPRLGKGSDLGKALTGAPGFEDSPLIAEVSRVPILNTIFEMAGIDSNVKSLSAPAKR